MCGGAWRNSIYTALNEKVYDNFDENYELGKDFVQPDPEGKCFGDSVNTRDMWGAVTTIPDGVNGLEFCKKYCAEKSFLFSALESDY